MEGQGLETGNYISSIGSVLMAVASVILVINIIITSVKNKKVGNDPWGDGRTLEWSISSPPPYYNFKQLPLVRSIDAYWHEKMEGRKEMPPAEPLGDIHMPNPSFIPFMISFGQFIAAFGAMYRPDYSWGLPVLIGGLVITFGSMLVRSLKDDLGTYIKKEELDDDKGVKA